MTTLLDTATSSATDVPQPSPAPVYNGTTPEPVVNRSTKSMRDAKYRHVFATHSQQRMSCLSHGAEVPSFVGFRNLMILVLGAHFSAADVGLSNTPQSSRI